MTPEEFDSQIERLKTTWPTSFSAEKIKLIWTAVYQLDFKWFKKTVNNFLANNRIAPLPVEFISAASAEGRRQYTSDLRFPTRNEIHPSENSMFSKDDIAEMFSMMKKRLLGQISFEELEQYGKMIAQAVKKSSQCERCIEGIVFIESSRANSTVFKCRCPLGQRRTEVWASV